MKRLTKSNNRMLSGVLGGAAEYMEMDPTLIRLLFVLIAVMTGALPCIIGYIIAAYVIPEPY